jgi:hypothetical protein
MARVNIVKQIKIDGNWVLRSIPKKPSGTYDWTALPEGTYFIEWRDNGQRKRENLRAKSARAIAGAIFRPEAAGTSRAFCGAAPPASDMLTSRSSMTRW